MITDLNKIRDVIIKEFGEKSCALFIFNKFCEEIIPQVSSYIPRNLILKWIKEKFTEIEFDRCTFFMVGYLKLFTVNHEYTDEDDNSFELDTEDLACIMRDEAFLHPENGIAIEPNVYKGKISTYYAFTSYFVELLTPEFLDCPFCSKNEAILITHIYDEDHYMKCENCKSRTGRYRTGPEAKEAWNNRIK